MRNWYTSLNELVLSLKPFSALGLNRFVLFLIFVPKMHSDMKPTGRHISVYEILKANMSKNSDNEKSIYFEGWVGHIHSPSIAPVFKNYSVNV